jgi:hypothetical protein
MKTSTFLTLLLATLSLNAFAGLNHPMDGKEETNLCDTLEDQAAIDECHKDPQFGKSASYIKKQENLAKTLKEEKVKADKIARLTKEITTEEFSYEQIKAKGFGKIYIAEKRVESGGVLGKPETVTAGYHMCRRLGFEKSQKTVIRTKHDNKTKALRVTEEIIGDKLVFEKYELTDAEKETTNLYPFESITCVKSRSKDNEVFAAIKEEVIRGEVEKNEDNDLTPEQVANKDVERILDNKRSPKESRKPAVVTESDLETQKDEALKRMNGAR